MAIAFRGAGTAVAAFNAGVTVSLPAGIQDNDLVIILAHSGSGFGFPAGWTIFQQNAAVVSQGNEGVAIASRFWRTGDPTTVAVTVTSGSTIAIAVAYSGLINAAVPIVSNNTWTGAVNDLTNPHTVTQPSFTTAIDGCLIVGLGYMQSGGGQTADTPVLMGAAATMDVNGAAAFSEAFYFYSALQASAGSTGTCSLTYHAGSKSYGDLIIAIQPPNAFSRFAYIFGAQQAVNRAATWMKRHDRIVIPHLWTPADPVGV